MAALYREVVIDEDMTIVRQALEDLVLLARAQEEKYQQVIQRRDYYVSEELSRRCNLQQPRTLDDQLVLASAGSALNTVCCQYQYALTACCRYYQCSPGLLLGGQSVFSIAGSFQKLFKENRRMCADNITGFTVGNIKKFANNVYRYIEMLIQRRSQVIQEYNAWYKQETAAAKICRNAALQRRHASEVWVGGVAGTLSSAQADDLHDADQECFMPPGKGGLDWVKEAAKMYADRRGV